MLKTLIPIIILSGAGASYVFFKRWREAMALSDIELVQNLKLSEPTFTGLQRYVVVPTTDYWKMKILPSIYKEIEKLIARVRINVLKIEGGLFRLVNYIRGKRSFHENANNEKSQYWKDVGDFKNETK